MDEIATRLTSILEQHGPRAIAVYTGTCLVHNVTAGAFARAFLQAIGSPMGFTPGMLDKPGKGIAQALHGRWMAPSHSFDEPDVVLLFGINPMVTYTGFPYGNPGKWLKDRLDKGTTFIVVDPRRSDIARRAQLFLQPRPGTDVAILAAMLNVVIAEGLYDEAFVTENVSGLEALRVAVAPFAPDLVASFADVDAGDLVQAARTFAGARRGYVMAGTGPAMSGPGTLVEYLVLNLETLCGHWLREGETVRTPGVLVRRPTFKAQAAPPRAGYGFGERLRVRGLTNTASGLPTAAASDEMLLDGEGRVRALISVGGNPIVAWPDQDKTRRGLKALDLLVQVDPWMSQTAKVADYIIAPTMVLETAATSQWMDWLSLSGTGYGVSDSYGQYVPAVVSPPDGAEVIEEWELFFGLAQRMGLTLALTPQLGLSRERVIIDTSTKPTSDELIDLLSAGSRIPLAEVKRHPHGAAFPDPSVRVLPKDPGWTGRLELADTAMMTDLSEAAQTMLPATGRLEDLPFRLLCRRMAHVYNSSYNDEVTHRGRPYNPAFMNPDDLDRIGADSGDIVEIRSAHGFILGVVEPDANLRPGLVSMAFGFGEASIDEQEVRAIGSSIGLLISNDVDFERYSGQPRMSNLPVSVRVLVDT
jgi:anaerobic selenocysteine-containing dehydrogenase